MFSKLILKTSTGIVLGSLLLNPTLALAATTPPLIPDNAPTANSSGLSLTQGWNYFKIGSGDCSIKNIFDELQADGGSALKLSSLWLLKDNAWQEKTLTPDSRAEKIAENDLVGIETNQKFFFDFDTKNCNTSENSTRTKEIESVRAAGASEPKSGNILEQLLSVPQTFWENLIHLTSNKTASSVSSSDPKIKSEAITVSDLAVTNKISAGLLWIDSLEGSLNSASTLKLQNNLGGNVDFLSGQVIIDKNGVVNANKFATKKSSGKATLKSGQSKVIISSDQVTDDSLVFITPTTLTDKVLSATAKNRGKDFTVETKGNTLEDTNFNWLIIN